MVTKRASAKKATTKATPAAKKASTPKGPAAAKLNAIGIDAICERIESGESQDEISASLKVGAATLSRWLDLPGHSEQSARARERSAEAWLDRGIKPLKQALTDKKVDAAAARAYEQACARRAALRNPRYVEKTAHEHSGPNGGPLTVTVKRYSDA